MVACSAFPYTAAKPPRVFWHVSNVKLAQEQLVKGRKARLSSNKCLNTLLHSLGMRMMVFQLDIDMNISIAGH